MQSLWQEIAGSGRSTKKAMFGPGSKPEIGRRYGGSGWGAGGPRGGGSHSHLGAGCLPSFDRRGKGSIAERGELQSAGSRWAWCWAGGVLVEESCFGHLKELDRKGENPRQRRGDGIGPEGLGLFAAGILIHFGACNEKTATSDFFLPSARHRPSQSKPVGDRSLRDRIWHNTES